MFVEMRAELSSASARLVGDEAKVEFRHRAAGEDGLAAGTGIARDQTLDIDGRLRARRISVSSYLRLSIQTLTPSAALSAASSRFAASRISASHGR
jgi:hypothetical protein